MNRRSLIKGAGILAGTTVLSGLPGIKAGAAEKEGDAGQSDTNIKSDWLTDGSRFITKVNEGNNQIELSNGLLRRVFRLKPACATIALDNLMTGESVLRAVRAEAEITLNGKKYAIGGLSGQPVQNYLSEEFLDDMTADPAAFHCIGHEEGPAKERFQWKRNEAWSSRQLSWPAPGKRISFHYIATEDATPDVQIMDAKVIYEMYDGIPVISKWIVVKNNGRSPVRLNSFKAEMLSVVETAPKIDDGAPREYRIYGRKDPPEGGTQTDAPRDYIDGFTQLFVVTDYAMGGDMEAMKDNPGVRWIHDPDYKKTGIGYYGERQPVMVECTPPFGPDIDIGAGESWESFHIFEMLRDSSSRERRGLAECRFWRMMAPWTQENPLFMHVREANTAAVKLAIDQCAAVGFELVIMTFGSGFNIEDKGLQNIGRMKELADYASSKGIAIGGYSLLASRGGPPEILIISEKTGEPATSRFDGARFGPTPCLASGWGADYFDTIKNFFEATGMNVLENDGSYPGDPCASQKHRDHHGFEDSQWRQWERIRDFYRWCRGRGIYLNVPDWHFLNGSSKTAMGYVENNWSLPREYQVIIERQNIYDGTWQKTPSMGWMFVPLTQYHGGGEAATIEPLREHLDHYAHRMADLFGAGVQAIYRGPRLYDTDETKAVVKKWVDFYKRYRAILDSDIIHLRRPDGHGWDGIMHVNPQENEKGLLMLYNPLNKTICEDIRVPLYYTGLTKKAKVREQEKTSITYNLDREWNITLPVSIPANGYTWYVIE